MKKIFFLLLLAVAGIARAEVVTYRLVQYNADANDFVISAYGQQPWGSVAYFDSEYGATYGNRFNQIPRNKKATLYLQGWDGCTVKSVTLGMCSNSKSGSFGLEVKSGETVLFAQSARDFADEVWYGEWVSKDLGIYVDIAKTMQNLQPVGEDEDLTICIKGGTSEGSVYVSTITVEYEPDPEASTESPMGYVYEKVEAKGTLSDGDIILFYRSGDAAGDIDGIETSHYLDAVGITSTSNVYEPAVEHFTLGHDEAGEHWTLTDQYGRLLGAKAAQHLAWDEGVTTWDITLGYNGATVASTNTKYGTMRYNAPSGSYPRFWNYTSTSLTLPYIYKRVRQNQPVVSTSLALSATERTVELGVQDTVVVRTFFTPSTVTDRHVDWASSNPSVATVRDGVVHILALGDTEITATASDGGSSATMLLHIVEKAADAISGVSEASSPFVVSYTLDGRFAQPSHRGPVIRNGKVYLKTK